MKNAVRTLALSSILLFTLTSCAVQLGENIESEPAQLGAATSSPGSDAPEMPAGEIIKEELSEEPGVSIQEPVPQADIPLAVHTISISEIPAYNGDPYVVVNDNVPYFTDDELSAASYEYYPELDDLGRCGVCTASIGQDIMPAQERGEIGSVKPSGWQTVKYPGSVDGNYLYNRCHLIAFQLAGENANTCNLITGTRYMNTEGMQPFENMVAAYVKETGNHVMYRVTPVFEGDNLVANGVLIEAESVEDGGKGILFNVFCYNVQPGIIIDYATGDSAEDERIVAGKEAASEKEGTPTSGKTQEMPSVAGSRSQTPVDLPPGNGAYAVNSNNGKIHIAGACPATGDGGNAMKHPVYFDTYEEAESYSSQIAPAQNKRKCGNCW